MLLTFCINEMEVHVKRDAERLLYINAAHVTAIRIDPTSKDADAVIYGNGQQFRVPFIGRNLTAVSAWQVYVESQKCPPPHLPHWRH